MKNEQALPVQPVDDATDANLHPKPGSGGVVRSGLDRRSFTWRTVVYSIIKPRRKRVNRADDKKNHHVDFHSKSTSLFCAGIVVMAATDALLTLYFYDLGLTQFNGLVLALLAAGRGFYVAAKLIAASLCVVLLSSVSSVKVFGLPARYFLYIVFFGYLAVILNMLRYFF